MSIGPVEYIIIGFPGNDFHGEIVPEIAKLVDSGTIRIVDLVFISKDDDGSFVVLEADEDDGVSVFASLDGEVGGFIGDEDIAHAAASIEPGNSAALLLWEDLWALPLVDRHPRRRRRRPRGITHPLRAHRGRRGPARRRRLTADT